MDGEVTEIRVYGCALDDDDERSTVEDHLLEKYDIDP